MPRPKRDPLSLEGLGLEKFDPKERMAKIRRLQMLTNSVIWMEDLAPMLRSRVEYLMARLRDRSESRAKQESDDYLWGRLAEVENFLEWPTLQVQGAFTDLQKALDTEDDGL